VVGAVGATISAVGAVTRDKALTYVGRASAPSVPAAHWQRVPGSSGSVGAGRQWLSRYGWLMPFKFNAARRHRIRDRVTVSATGQPMRLG
jgi:hypothetical protein